MGVQFLRPPTEAGLTIDPTERFDFSGLSMLAQRAQEAASISRERRTLRDLMGEPQPEAERGFMGGLKRVFGVGEEYQPISQIERSIAKAKISEKYPSPTDKLSLMVLENLSKQFGGAGMGEPAGGITPIGAEDISTVGGAPMEAPTTIPTPTPVVTEKGAPVQFIKIRTGEVDTRGLPKYTIKDNPKYKEWISRQQKQQEGKIKAKAEVLKLSEKAKANFGRAMGMFSTIVAQAKGMQEEQKGALGKIGIKTTGLGLLSGAVGGLAVKTRRPGFGRTAAFRGQQKETAISLNSILTGQNRVIRSVVKMIQETLPETNDPEDIMSTKLAQSINNAYKLVKSFEKAGYTSEELQKMSEAELDGINADSLIRLYTLSAKEKREIERIIQDVLGAPAMPARTFIDKPSMSKMEAVEELRRLGEIK